MERRSIAIRGTVQGVGFRPFVYHLAERLQLGGFVRNSTGGVQIEVEGDGGQLDQFVNGVLTDAPPLARIEELHWEPAELRGDEGFRIETSAAQGGEAVVISPDAAACADCVAELFDPADRRFRYPFLNCTNCGPRLTIITGAPYDRAKTTMARFRMCPQCEAEYDDPGNRRFHAQPTACAKCGPRLWLADGEGKPIASDDPLANFVAAIREGRIGAMKGLGGYHLVCDARNEAAVTELRRRKHRDDKPFAVMAADAAAASELCEIDEQERKLLTSVMRPIVLLRKLENLKLASGVAPGNPMLGIMLPYTPLHHLLMHDLTGMVLVMTSGNRADEPIATGEPEVFERLSGIADFFLGHDREIHVRCDDSVTRIIGGREAVIRRSRGYAPQPIPLKLPCKQPGLAVGGQMKGTFALWRSGEAIVSHHLGDLDHFEAYRAFEKDLELYERTFEVKPTWIAHDLHPDYASTRYALKRAHAQGLRAIAVQHHHAHMASVLAEHGVDGPAIGVSFDGTGFGTDQTIWGGEFLVGDLRGFQRAAHLRPVAMPGAEAAVREPWRMALSHMRDAQVECPMLQQRIDAHAWRAAGQMLERRFNSPMTSSAGRLFDAVAAMLGVRNRVNYEGQAAIELQWLADDGAGDFTPDAAYEYSVGEAAENEAMQIDTRPLIRVVAKDLSCGVSSRAIARRFHASIIHMIGKTCEIISEKMGIRTVTLSGGVFMNALVLDGVKEYLTRRGFLALQNSRVPSNDGGVSLGQLAVAAALMAE